MGNVNKPTGVRWLVFALVGATSWLLYLHRYAWGIIKPEYRRENPDLTLTDIGYIDSAFMVAYAVGQIPLGYLGDRLGPRWILGTLVLIWSLAVAALGWMDNYWLLFALMGFFGLAQAGAYPLISKITRVWFPGEYRTTVQAVITSLGRAGGACAPLIIATFLLGRLQISWHEAPTIIALPGLLLCFLILYCLTNTPQAHPWTNDAERALLAPSNTPGAGTTQQRVVLDKSPATLFSFGAVLTYAFASTFADMLYVYLIPTFLREGKGLSQEEMGVFAPLPLIGGAFGGFVGGMLNDMLIRRLGNRRWGRSLVAITGKTVGALLIALSVTIPDGQTIMVLLLLSKFFGDWSLPTQWGAITDMAGGSAATIFAIVNTVGGIGGMLAPPLMGYVKDQYGWNALLYFVAAVYLFAACAWLFIDARRPLVKS